MYIKLNGCLWENQLQEMVLASMNTNLAALPVAVVIPSAIMQTDFKNMT